LAQQAFTQLAPHVFAIGALEQDLAVSQLDLAQLLEQHVTLITP